MPAVRWSGEIPGWPHRFCGGPPGPPPARGEGQRPTNSCTVPLRL
jgi:hypothetical protein